MRRASTAAVYRPKAAIAVGVLIDPAYIAMSQGAIVRSLGASVTRFVFEGIQSRRLDRLFCGCDRHTLISGID